MKEIINKSKTKSQNVFYGWYIIFAGFFINAFGVGTFFYGFSTFFLPMITEFGSSRALMSTLYSLSRLEGGIEGPIVGWLIDRYGARRMIFIGITMTGIGFILLSQATGMVSLFLIFGLTLSLGFNMGYMHATGAAAAKWFIKKRSRAFSILTTGNGIGGAIFVPVIAWLILQYGWRTAAVIIGVATLLIPLPLAIMVRSTPEEMGLKPDGENDQKQKNVSSEGTLINEESTNIEFDEDQDFTVKEAFLSPTFWIYSLSMVLRACILSSIVIHQIPHLVDIGISKQTAANVLGMMVLMSVPGRFIFGLLGDWFNKKVLLFLLCVLQGIGILIFIHANTTWLLFLFVLVYGSGYGGAIPLSTSLRADLFGRKNYATIAGFTMTITMIGTVSAPILAGRLYDVTNSYSIAFYTFSVLIVLSGICFLLIPNPVKKKKEATLNIV